MVTILQRSTRKAQAFTTWEVARQVSAGPLVAPPCYPQIEVSGLPHFYAATDYSHDERLSRAFSESGFNLEVSIMDGACFIDSHAKFTCYAVGARIDLLHRRFGVGHYLLNLINCCPIDIWNPRDLFTLAQDQFNLEFRAKCVPDWVWEPAPKINVPKALRKLPPNLRKLCKDAEDMRSRACDVTEYGEYPDNDHYELPAVILSWWDNIHWYNSHCPDNPSYTLEQGGNPAFALMDSYAEITIQTGANHMGSPLFHDLDQVRELIEAAKPYAKLINYLSHNEYECGFAMSY